MICRRESGKCNHLTGLRSYSRPLNRSGHSLFALIGALQGTEDLEERALTYDVACIIIHNLLTRCREYFPEKVAMLENLQVLLPKLHMYAHKDLCQIVYSLAYSTGFGLSHSEGVETPWAEFNIAGLPTREMSAGARHDALTDLFSFWNWRKVEKMGTFGLDLSLWRMLSIPFAGEFLAGKVAEAYHGQNHTTRHLAGLTALATPNTVAAWLHIPFDANAPTPMSFRAKEAAFASSPFLVNQSQCTSHWYSSQKSHLTSLSVPTAKEAYASMIKEHAKGSQPHTRQVMLHMRKQYASFLMTGLDWEREMYVHDCTRFAV